MSIVRHHEDSTTKIQLLEAFEMSGSVARHLSGCHIAPKGVRNETDGTATGDPEDEI